MSLDRWLAFVAASAALLATPDPAVLVIFYAPGREPAAAIVAGILRRCHGR